MKKKFEYPKMNISIFSKENIITSSGGNGGTAVKSVQQKLSDKQAELGINTVATVVF